MAKVRNELYVTAIVALVAIAALSMFIAGGCSSEDMAGQAFKKGQPIAMSAPPECSDEDGGLIYDEKGAVRGQDYETGEEGVFIDYCNSEESLHEYYCLKEDDYEYVYRNNILCYERIPGSECFEGVCVVVECTDSDGGENLEEVGETKGKYGTVGMTTMTDECKSDTEVLEYTCVDEWIQRNTIECPGNKTCTGGVCV